MDSIGNVGDELRWGYDLRGRLKADTSYLLASSGSPQVTTHVYDAYERDSLLIDRLGSWGTGYEASRGMANRLITPYADTVTYTFDNLGRASEPTIRNGGLKVSGQRIWKFNRSLGTDSVFAYGPSGSYVVGLYDRADADTGYQALAPEWSEQQGAGTTAIAWKDSVTYDGWNRLASWSLMRNGAAWATDSGYTFDRAGNISQATAASYDGTTDRLTGRDETGGTRTFTYDRDGNLVTSTSPGGVVLTGAYDALDRLVAVRQNGTLIARYGYDVLGRRVAKRVYSAASGGTVGYTRYTYRGSNVLYESDSAGTVTRSYTWGGTNRLLAFHEGSAHYYVIADRLGSVRSILGADGSWLMSQRFTPYGARQSVDSAGSYPALPYGWTGREYDPETGFYYLRARYYLPLLRRFVQADPAGYGGGGNLYAYVGGDPLEAFDPTGTKAVAPASYTPWDAATIEEGGNEFASQAGGGGSGWNDPTFWSPEMDAYARAAEASVTSRAYHTEFIAHLADGSTVSCAKIAAQCGDYLQQNGDPLLESGFLGFTRALLDAGIKFDGRLRDEVGGWCSATGCDWHFGNKTQVLLGNQPGDAIFGWHTHPNVGMPAPPTPHCHSHCVYGAEPSGYYWENGHAYLDLEDGGDVITAMEYYRVPMYVVSANAVWRYQAFDDRAPQLCNVEPLGTCP